MRHRRLSSAFAMCPQPGPQSPARAGTSPTLANVTSRPSAKLGYFWRHAYAIPRSGRFNGNVVNPDTGLPMILGEDQLRRSDFRKVKIAETVWPESPKSRSAFFSPLWQADNHKIHRMAPIEFIGRYMDGFFDYGIADEVHELKSGETAQGNALGTLGLRVRSNRCPDRDIARRLCRRTLSHSLPSGQRHDARRRIRIR